jgi:sortase A
MKSALRLLLVAILLPGICLCGRALYLHAKAELAGVLIRKAWAKTIATGKTEAPWSWADTHPIARLEIPSIGYDEIVLEGATPRTLAFGPARLRSSAKPGEEGNMVIAGHRTSWFEPLRDIRAGASIRVEWFDATERRVRQRSYVVRQLRITRPRDVSLLSPTPDTALTLITCYPFGSSPRSPQRFVVRAEALESQSSAAH